MTLPIHNQELSVWDMVLNRLPFLENTPTNEDIASDFTLEMMNELELCFKVNKDLVIPPDTSRIGDENYYTMAQRVILADLVSYYILFRFSVANTAGDPNDPSVPVPTNSFLKKAKADVVEVEFEQIDVKKSGLLSSTVSSMLSMFKASAIRKARVLGCMIDVCDDCVAVTGCSCDMSAAGFIVTNVSSGNSGYDIIERA